MRYTEPPVPQWSKKSSNVQQILHRSTNMKTKTELNRTIIVIEHFDSLTYTQKINMHYDKNEICILFSPREKKNID